jgi:hypothetical protein
MLRKTIIAVFAVATIGALSIDAASARGGFGGGGGGGGGGFARGGGMGGGGFRSASIGGGGFRSAAIGGGGFRSAAIGGGAFRSAAIGSQFRGVGPGFRHGFHGRGRGLAFAAFGAGLGYGLYDPYGYDYAYDDSYYGDGGCYLVRQRVLTRYGWRIRPVQVCG